MSRIINPFDRQNVQFGDKQRMCAIVHRTTKRILGIARDDPFAHSFKNAEYEVIEIKHAHEFDKWSRQIREQAKVEHEEEEFKLMQREKPVRDMLRKQLRDRLAVCSGPERMWIDSFLRVLDYKEQKRKRYSETFMVAEAVEGAETKSNIGEDLAKKIICNE